MSLTLSANRPYYWLTLSLVSLPPRLLASNMSPIPEADEAADAAVPGLGDGRWFTICSRNITYKYYVSTYYLSTYLCTQLLQTV